MIWNHVNNLKNPSWQRLKFLLAFYSCLFSAGVRVWLQTLPSLRCRSFHVSRDDSRHLVMSLLLGRVRKRWHHHRERRKLWWGCSKFSPSDGGCESKLEIWYKFHEFPNHDSEHEHQSEWAQNLASSSQNSWDWTRGGMFGAIWGVRKLSPNKSAVLDVSVLCNGFWRSSDGWMDDTTWLHSWLVLWVPFLAEVHGCGWKYIQTIA